MSSYKDNALPLEEGKVNLTSGTIEGGGVFVCISEGELTVTWNTDNTDTLNCLAGDAINLRNSKSVQIVSGKFHRA